MGVDATRLCVTFTQVQYNIHRATTPLYSIIPADMAHGKIAGMSEGYMLRILSSDQVCFFLD
jgi:hypothetical protein